MRVLQRTGVSLVALAVAGMPLVAASPASAAPTGPARSAASLVPCLTNLPTAGAHSEDERDVPKWREHADTDSVTQATSTRYRPSETRKGFVAREVDPELPARGRIPIYVHVIKGTHRGERVPAGPKRVRNG